MITDYQWLWLILAVLCGIYAMCQYSRLPSIMWEIHALPVRIRSRAFGLMCVLFFILTIVSIVR
jgi:hypothetical protein